MVSMKAISITPTEGLQVGAQVNCIDNTGAKLLEIISVVNYKGTRRRIPAAGVGDVVMCSVKKGTQKMVHEVVRAVIVRQKKSYRRPSGIRIKFEDNAAVLLDDKDEPKGKEIKGVVAKECVERFSVVGKIARAVI